MKVGTYFYYNIALPRYLFIALYIHLNGCYTILLSVYVHLSFYYNIVNYIIIRECMLEHSTFML